VALAGLAVLVIVLLVGAAQLVPGREPPGERRGRTGSGPRRDVVLLWVVFAGGTAPGLLLFAHAVTVAGDRQLGPRAAGLAVSALAAGNLIGRLVAGAGSDRTGRLPALAAALTMCTVSIGALAVPASLSVLLVGFLGTGLAYGAVSALVPAATADRVGAAAFSTAYGVVFTGWGAAGLLAPVAGGPLVDLAEQEPALLGLAATPLLAAGTALVLLSGRAVTEFEAER
jgi:MFS family permease